jgi:hypothetical protein
MTTRNRRDPTALRHGGTSGGGFVDSVSMSVGEARTSPAPSGGRRRVRRLAVDDRDPTGPVTVTPMGRDDGDPRLTPRGRFKVG